MSRKSMPIHRFTEGSRVTCSYRGREQGVVLAFDDPRAWAGSLAFPSMSPDPKAVREYVKGHIDKGGRWIFQPVLWDFGQVYWDEKLELVEVDDVITDEPAAVLHA